MLGGSESGTNCLSLKKFEDTFSLVIDEVPGTDIRHVVCTNFIEPWKGTILFTFLEDHRFLLLDWSKSEKTENRITNIYTKSIEHRRTGAEEMVIKINK